MANIFGNISIRGLTDILDDPFMHQKTRSGETILARKLMAEFRQEAATEKTTAEALREATTYANFAQLQDAYVQRGRRYEVPAYTMAFADWFSAPRVLEIDVDAWTGEPGQKIRVKARDRVCVTGVSVMIRDQDGNVIESGMAKKGAGSNSWWEYTTRSQISLTPFPIVEAVARNLPGHQDSFAIF
jgi:hypothetical protein